MRIANSRAGEMARERRLALPLAQCRRARCPPGRRPSPSAPRGAGDINAPGPARRTAPVTASMPLWRPAVPPSAPSPPGRASRPPAGNGLGRASKRCRAGAAPATAPAPAPPPATARRPGSPWSARTRTTCAPAARCSTPQQVHEARTVRSARVPVHHRRLRGRVVDPVQHVSSA